MVVVALALALADLLVLTGHARCVGRRQVALAPAASHNVLRLDHLLDVLALETGLVLVRAGGPPVDEIGAASRIAASKQDKHANDQGNAAQA